MRNVLLITSTIAPPEDAADLAWMDPTRRLAEYKASLEFQIGLLKRNRIDAIVYADNSGFPLDQLRDICIRSGVASRVELISFRSEAPPGLGRFFLEISLIDKALAASEVLVAESSLRIWKLTGRYIVKNIDKIIERAPDCEFYVNCRNYPLPWADFYLTAFTLRGYSEIITPCYERFRNTLVGERVLREVVDSKNTSECRVVRRFNQTPRLAGVRGKDGASYSSLGQNAKFGVRFLANRLVPALWI